MDWVPGGIDRMFATYERIVSHQHADQQADDRKPPINAPNEPVKPDEPPWYGPRPLTTKEERDAQRLKDTGGFPDRMEAGEQRLRDHILNPPGLIYKHP